MKKFSSKYKLEISIFSLALVARLVLFSINFSSNEKDFLTTIKGDDGYYELSQGIMSGHGFTWDTEPPYTPNSLRPPVWPLLIAFFAKTFESYVAVFIFEIILGSLIPVLAFRLAAKLFGRRIGKWTAFIMCLEPYLVLFSFIMYTETSFIFFFLLSLIFLFDYIKEQTLRRAVWFSVFFGLAMLIKPTIQYLPILIPIGLAIAWRRSLSRDHAKHLAAFILVIMALIAPWLYRNHVEFNSWSMSAQPAFNLYVYLVPTVLAIDKGTDFKTELDLQVGKDFDANTIDMRNGAEYQARALAVLKDHKSALVKSGLITLATFFTHDGMLTVLGHADIRFENISKPAVYLISHFRELISAVIFYAKSPAILILLMRLFWVLVSLFFVFGIYRNWKREGVRTTVLLSVCLVLYFAATTAINGFGVNARFRMPVDVFILGFALYGLFSLKRDNTTTVSAQK